MQLEGSASDLPLTLEDFHDVMSAVDLGATSKIAIAVSGGGDSMALAYLLKCWCDNQNICLIAVTVDHGLRTDSATEAEQVGQWMAELGVEHYTLHWNGKKPTSNIQDEARAVRYTLLASWCAENQIGNLFTAHHLDDQAETFLMRLFRGSGVDGLSAMDASTTLPFNVPSTVILHRPLLTIPKVRLIGYLKNANKTWFEDPSNIQQKYTRIKVRDLLNEAAIDGLNAQRMAATARRMTRVKSLLDELTDKAESRFLTVNSLGYAELDRDFYHETHEEIALRLLSKCLKLIGGQQYGPRLNKLENLLGSLTEKKFSGQTLSGTMIAPAHDGKIIICREANVISEEIHITTPKQYLWDNRFIVNSGKFNGQIVKMGVECFTKVKQLIPDINGRLSEHFGNAARRDRIVPSLPCIVEPCGNVVLWDHLLSLLERTDLDGFSADFKE